MLSSDKTVQRSTFFKYVIPSIGAMLVTSLYVVVDGVFVGNGIGSDALAAINIAAPFVMTVIALAMMVTVGGATMTAINIGKGDNKTANNYFLVCCKVIVIFSLLMTVVAVLFPKQIVRVLGANDKLVDSAAIYLKYFVIFCIFFCSAMVLSAFVRNDGDPKLSFWGMVAGGVSNIFLDWLFIFPLHMGIKGSAIASGLGQLISCLILITHFIKKRGVLRFSKSHASKGIFKEICKRGTPEFMNQLFQPITILCYNLIAIRVFGEIGVAAFSVVYYILTISVSVFIGLTQGTQPLISYSYGEGNKVNEKYFYKHGLILNTFLALLIYILMFFFGEGVIMFFNKDSSLVRIGYECIKIYGLSFIFTAINIVNISYYTAIKETKSALILSTIRCLVLIPLFVFITPLIFGRKAIWLGITVAEIFALLGAFVINKKNNKISRK